MSQKQENIWIGEKDLNRDKQFMKESQDEFKSLPIVESMGQEEVAEGMKGNRRDFLKLMGFGLGAATVAAGCEIPVRKAIPYVVQPDEIVPGVATYYASSFVDGGDYCPILVKTREGRPIKIEGNDLSPMNNGGTSARTQASVLGLYDYSRFKQPAQRGADGFEKSDWETMDQIVTDQLSSDSQIRIVSRTIMSPSTEKSIEEFKKAFPSTVHVMYDPVSLSGMLDANKACFGKRAIPDYHFDKAKFIVSFDADFLGTWISPIEFANDYVQHRKIEDTEDPEMSRHVQVESHMTLTGSNADNRVMIKPSEQGAAIATLYNEVARLTGGQTVSAPSLNDKASKALKNVARQLVEHKGQSLIVSGSNNKGEQVLINALNDLLENIGKTVDYSRLSYQRRGSDSAMKALVDEMKQGGVDALFVMDANPAFDGPDPSGFAEAMDNVPFKVSMNRLPDETTDRCDWIAPDHHGLESWGDVRAKDGHLGLIQPTIAPLFETRQKEESFLRWSESGLMDHGAEQPVFEFVRSLWKKEYFPRQNTFSSFTSFWDKSLHDGVVLFDEPQPSETIAFQGDVVSAANDIKQPSEENGVEIAIFESVNMGAGQHANNPWLMEMPDPLTRCTWGNYLAIPTEFDGYAAFEGMNGLKDGDLAKVTVDGKEYILPVIQQFGVQPGTVAVALGYGRRVSGPCGQSVGVDVQPWITREEGKPQYYATGVTVSGKVGEEEHFSCVQYHHTMGVKAVEEETGDTINADEAAVTTLGQGFQGSLVNRSIIRRSHVDNVEEFIHDLEHEQEHFEHLNEETIYPYEEYKEELYEVGHHWGMHIDLNACIGCGACTVACMAENNVPVVGKKEVARHHEMTWLRIDRYFYGDVENPNVVYQPMLCQHCDNAPCENVCPVNATNHSSEGINQMAYNRCIGTRYCANNCPYKVRRFNWLDYTTADTFPENEPYIKDEEIPYGADNLTRMVLNPDVTVRSRGVMEKCTFCVQRIQKGKLTAKKENRALRDADVKTACQTACPTGAITFGDTNKEDGDLREEWDSPLTYSVLEEVNTRPSIKYSGKLNNKDESLDT